MIGYELIVIAAMLILNAIFAAYEMGLASISRARLSVLFNEKKKGSPEAMYMKDKMEASLATIQLGITMAGSLAAATGGIGIKEVLVPYFKNMLNFSEILSEISALILLIIPLTFFTIVFAELVPKMIALNNKELIVLKFSPMMKIISKIAYPIIYIIEVIVKKVVDIVTKLHPKELTSDAQGLHELKAAVSFARASKLFGAREEKILLSAAHLSARPVSDIIIPAQDISMINIENTLAEALIKAHLDMHTRFPVCSKEADPQTIEGYVNFKDIVMALRVNPNNPTLRGISRPIKKIGEDTPISHLLEKMIQEKIHIVLVTSNNNAKVLGMVTLEDIIEELVGEIEDEFDRLPTHIHNYGSGWIMGGGVPMNTVISTVGITWTDKLPEGRILTLDQWCRQKAGDKLYGGEIIESNNLRVIPRKFRRKQISEALVDHDINY